MRIFSRLPLATRLAAFAILTLCPVAILLIFSHFHDRGQRRDAGIIEADSYGRNVANQLESGARDLDGFMGASALLLGSDNGPITQESAGNYLHNLQSRYDNISALFVTDLAGRVIAQQDGKDIGLDLSGRPYITELQKGDVDSFWSGGITGSRTSSITIAFSHVIYQDGGKTPKAYLVAAFRPSDVSAPPANLAKDANIVLIDQNGQVIYSARDPQLSHTPRDVANAPLVQTALAGQVANVKNQGTPFDSGNRYGVIVPVPHIKWLVAYTRSQSALDSSLTDRLLRDFGIMSAVIALTIVALVVAARQMVKPIGEMAAAAHGIATGKRVAMPSASRDPDVAKLQEAFATMSTAVAEREDRLREQARVMETLEEVGARVASDLDFETTVQAITDAGTRLTEAEFGAFFYNVTNAEGESYVLYTLAGVDPSHFENFPMPRNTGIFAPTFKGEGVVRLDDVTKDPRFGKNPPYNGMPEGHLPVHSYLAAPVFGRNGDVLGGLFFGHSRVGVFTERHESLVRGVASWAAIALNNAQTYRDSQEAQEVLRKANAAKDEFLGVVSHELRTPTTTIYGGIRMLDTRRHLLSQDATEELIHTMSGEAERLVRLIENLLVFARLELGRMPELEPVNMGSLMDEMLEAFRRTHADRAVETNVARDLPIVLAQSTSLERVLENLLSNADKYSPQGEPLSVHIEPVDDELQVRVVDHGKGVPEDELELIFDSFYRSPGANQLASGHGLGLSISKRIIDAHLGRIWARNLPGGFEVGFALPLEPTSPTEDVISQNGAPNGHNTNGAHTDEASAPSREDLTHAG